MTPAAEPSAAHPPRACIPPLIRGLCEKIDHDISELAWLLAGHPGALPENSIQTILKLSSTINEIHRQIRD